MSERDDAADSRLSIGQAAKLCQVTQRAIRLYEQLGLLQTERDLLNRRSFDAAACEQLQWISLLRNAGLGLADIGEVLSFKELEGPGRELALTKLSAKRSLVERELESIDLASVKLRESEITRRRIA